MGPTTYNSFVLRMEYVEQPQEDEDEAYERDAQARLDALEDLNETLIDITRTLSKTGLNPTEEQS